MRAYRCFFAYKVVFTPTAEYLRVRVAGFPSPSCLHKQLASQMEGMMGLMPLWQLH